MLSVFMIGDHAENRTFRRTWHRWKIVGIARWYWSLSWSEKRPDLDCGLPL